MAGSSEEAMFEEFSGGLSRLFGEYERRERNTCTQSKVINVPYSRELSLQRGLSQLLQGAEHLRTIPLEGSIESAQLSSGVNALHALVLSEGEVRRQSEVNCACENYAREFENNVALAFSLVRDRQHYLQSLLPIQTREFNGRSAIDALKALSMREINGQNIADAAAELGRIRTAFFYSASNLHLLLELAEARRYSGRGGIGNK